jgi:hypothetical protein
MNIHGLASRIHHDMHMGPQRALVHGRHLHAPVCVQRIEAVLEEILFLAQEPASVYVR